VADESKLANLWAQYGRVIMIFCMCALFLHDVFGAHGFLAMQRTKTEIARVQTNIDRLTKENAELAQEARELKSDPHKIESIARCELGLAKPGEIIINSPLTNRPAACEDAKP
jgi:cell division protein FtsB